MSGLFITGTDTGVGKTVASAALLHALTARGLTCVGMKPVAAGCEWLEGGWRSSDALILQAASSVKVPYGIANPVALPEPIAPEIAARKAGTPIELASLLASYAELAQRARVVVVEGVGGFRVPLADGVDTADLAAALGLPVVLVVGIRLGCLNHALLTAEAIRVRGLSLAGWIANRIDPGMQAAEENIESLNHWLAPPCLGRFPHLLTGNANAPVDPATLATHLHIDAIMAHLNLEGI